MSLELSLILIALFLVVYVHVWSNPERKVEESVKVVDRKWTVKDRPEGGFLIIVESV